MQVESENIEIRIKMNVDNNNLAQKASFTIIFDLQSGQILISFTCAIHKNKLFVTAHTAPNIMEVANNWMWAHLSTTFLQIAYCS